MPVASVAAGFPAGQTSMTQRLAEIKEAVSDGALGFDVCFVFAQSLKSTAEIDIVISRAHVLGARWKELYDEVKLMRQVFFETFSGHYSHPSAGLRRGSPEDDPGNRRAWDSD